VCNASYGNGASGAAVAAAKQLRTPHSGYHYDGRPDRFFEGWYFKVYIPQVDQSFALIYSIEDPKGSQIAGVGAQIMGPEDGYLIQYSKDVSSFWASPNNLELGATFATAPGARQGPNNPLPKEEFGRQVSLGFQATPTLHQGSIVADEEGAAGELPSTVRSASWCFTLEPKSGWGSDNQGQQATAGWLAALPIFEPHWQILMAHGEATGWLQWGDKRYEFQAAPAYSEKNWGGGFPKRWFWIQCNTFDGHPGTSLTAVGARRGIPLVPGLEEDVGMIGVHHQGTFIELMPQNSEIQWAVEPWGSWRAWGMSEKYEVMVEAATSQPGTPLRAPTATEGLAPFCRDTFAGKCRICIWERDVFGLRKGRPSLDAVSTSAALEVGGGPWWSGWKAQARMSEPIRALINLPIEGVVNSIPTPIRPPGL